MSLIWLLYRAISRGRRAERGRSVSLPATGLVGRVAEVRVVMLVHVALGQTESIEVVENVCFLRLGDRDLGVRGEEMRECRRAGFLGTDDHEVELVRHGACHASSAIVGVGAGRSIAPCASFVFNRSRAPFCDRAKPIGRRTLKKKQLYVVAGMHRAGPARSPAC